MMRCAVVNFGIREITRNWNNNDDKQALGEKGNRNYLIIFHNGMRVVINDNFALPFSSINSVYTRYVCIVSATTPLASTLIPRHKNAR